LSRAAISIEHQASLGRREQAEVRQMRVTAALHADPRAGGALEVVGHDLGGAPVEGEWRHQHPAVADRNQVRQPGPGLLFEQVEWIGPVGGGLEARVAGPGRLDARGLAAGDPFGDGEMRDGVRFFFGEGGHHVSLGLHPVTRIPRSG
jgi:hypothetical protein